MLAQIDWSLLINTLFWNFNGAVSVSVFGGEVRNPGRTYPRAMVISVVLIALSYLVPLFGATAFNTPHWTTWEEGTFSSISKAIGGNFLSNWIVLATFCSNAGMYIAELFCDSFQILGMAECGLAPSFLKKYVCVLLYCAVLYCIVLYSHDIIVYLLPTDATSALTRRTTQCLRVS